MREVPFTVYCDEEMMWCQAPVRQHFWSVCAANGLPHVVLTTEIIRAVMGNYEMAEQFRKDAAVAGVKFVDAHAPFGPREDLGVDGDGRNEMLARTRLAIEIAASFGVETITFHIGHIRPEYGYLTKEQLVVNACETLHELLPVAERCGIIIAVENIWFPGCLAGDVVKIVQQLNSPYVGACFDAGHANLMEHGVLHEESDASAAWGGKANVPWSDKTLETLLPYLVSTHLHDNDGQRDRHLLPGSGNAAWERIVPMLKRAPRLRVIQSETSPMLARASYARVAEVYTRLLGLDNGMVRMAD